MSYDDETQILPPPPPLDIKVQPAEQIRGPPDAYKNESTPRGAVFIANYKTFQPGVDLETRDGSEKDVLKLFNLFQQMGYKIVEGLSDGTLKQTDDALRSFRDEEIHEEVDSMVVIIMSHGNEGDVFATSDGELMNCEDVFSLFSNTACPALREKPKLFIFQMCRGENEHIKVGNVQSDATPITAWPQRKRKAERQISDIFVCFSSLSGFASYRHSNHGSIFVHHVCKTFMEHAKDRSLNILMKKVNSNVPEAVACETREMAANRELYFNPSADQVTDEAQFSMELVGKQMSYSRTGHVKACSQELQGMVQRNEKKKSTDLLDEATISPEDNPTDPFNLETQRDEVSDHARSTHRKLCGIVLIINNLLGCCKDVENLNAIFSFLGYDVQGPFYKLTRDEVLEKVREFQNTSNTRSVFIIFYGDGFEDYLVSSDRRVITYKELFQILNDNNCPNMAGKPKIFLFNTCFYDGEVDEATSEVVEEVKEAVSETSEAQAEVPVPEEWSTDGPGAKRKMVALPAERDMMVFSVEVDGQCKQGSRLTDALYQVLLTNDGSKEIVETMRLVFRRLMELQDTGEEQYYTEMRSINFKQDFYIIPPTYTPPPPTPTTPTPLILGKCLPQFQRQFSVKEVKQPITGPDIYQNISVPRGLALIIRFSNAETQWKEEARMLGDIFSQCGYNVKSFDITSSHDMKGTLQEFKDNNHHRKMDSSIITGLGLAKDQNTFYTSDGGTVSLQDFYCCFTNTACPALMHKPKLFFFHMTFIGDKIKTGHSVKEDLEDAFILRLSSVVKDVGEANRPTAGIEMMCRKLENHAHDTPIDSMVTQMKVALSIDPDCKDEAITTKELRFLKQFYLNPMKKMGRKC